MTDQEHELPTLAPSPVEIGMTAVVIVNALLIAIVVVQLIRGKMTLPHGVWGFVVLVGLPIVGPLLVLTWQRRVDRYRARTQHAAA